jgi:hypothetical protein
MENAAVSLAVPQLLVDSSNVRQRCLELAQ